MPRKNLAGTFEGHPAYRWKKMVRGETWVLLCRAKKEGEEKERTGWLGLREEDWTKERSQHFANEWWEKKSVELARKQTDPEKSQALEDIQRKLAWATINAPKELAGLRQVEKEIKTQPPTEIILSDQESISRNLQVAQLVGIEVPPDTDPIILQHFFGDKRVWEERLSNSKSIERRLTLAHQLAAFFLQERQRLKPQSYKELRDHFELLSQHLGPQLDCSQFNEQTVNSHYLWLAGKTWSAAGKNKRLGFFRRFVSWLWTTKVLENVPRNLKLRTHRFKSASKPIKKFVGVKGELDRLSDSHRLWALLGLNCGMTQADLGSLTWDMIDMKAGTLTRKRVKTEQESNVPVVTYRLFPETMKLLKSLAKRSGDGLVFTTSAGHRMYEVRYEDSETGMSRALKKDLFSTYWNRQTPKPKIPLGKYRSIAATALKRDNRFRSFVDYFLGHSPKEISDKHYSAEWDESFFEALDFIHKTVLDVKS